MESILYKELYELENKHWWFVSKRSIVNSLIEKYLKDDSNNKIFDAGCGCGLMLNDLKKFGSVYAMDYSDEAISFSKQMFDGEVKKGFLPGNIPFSKEYFDLIIILDVLEHLDDDLASLRCIKEHLSNNGICIVTVPAYMFLWSRHDTVHGHKRRYTIKELKQKLLATNFKILKISYYNTLMFLPIMFMRVINNLLKSNNNSDAKMPNKFLNFVLQKIFSSEKYVLKLLDMKFGVSIIAVVKNL